MHAAFSPSLKKHLLLIALLFCFNAAVAQVNYKAVSLRIDSLANIGLPKSALKQVDKLDSLARKNDNPAQQVRAAIYRMTFQSYLEENALEAIISRLKTDIKEVRYPVKPILQSLLAQMYWNYYQQNRYQFSRRTRQQKPDSDFTNWDLQTIITKTGRLYDLSLAEAVKEQSTPISVLDGVLEGDSTTRYLRPTLYDLLVQRAFDFFLADEASINKPRLPFSLNDERIFSGSKTFAALAIKTTDTGSAAYKGIKYLQQATAFHLGAHQDEALADLDMQRLKFLRGRSGIARKDSLYLSALKHIAGQFSDKPISSEALVLEGQYYRGIDSLVIAYGFFKKAVEAWPESLGGKNAAVLMKQIEEKELGATVEDVNVPDKPILALLSYKNLTAANIEVYKLSISRLDQFENGFDTSYANKSQYKLAFLKKFSPVQTKTISWNNLNDFKEHRLEFKVDALIPGNYILVVKDTASSDNHLAGFTSFKISNLAYAARRNPNDEMELRVMNRQTGAPIQGAQIHLSYREMQYNNDTKRNDWIAINADGVSDRNGFFKTDKFTSRYNNLSVSVIMDRDTLIDKSEYIYGAIDDSDNEEPEDKTVLFTDRQIYRPGQTIYFKALQLQTLNGNSKIMPGKNVEVQFTDVNDKQISSLKSVTNEFGTVSGSFIIPQTMLDGVVTLKTEDGQVEVKVEEYKRPTFQVEFLPVKESYKLNDSVTIKGNVVAFSGYGLSQAKVAYHIVRSQKREIYYSQFSRGRYRPYYGNNVETEIKTDTVTTDSQGRFKIEFKAVPGDSNGKNNIDYNYTISADVTDESGETRSGVMTLIVGNNDIKIDSYIPDRLFAKDTLKGPIKIKNLNGQAEKGNIKVDVYALKSPERIFKNRLWQLPDQFIINKSDFKKDFPEYAYANEDQVGSWPALGSVLSSTIAVDAVQPATINLKTLSQQPSGMYKIVMSARNEKGDTASVTKYVNFIAETPRPLNSGDWVIPVHNDVKAGDTARFLVGIGQKTKVLMERYNGAKLVLSKWMTIEKGQQKISIPIADTDKDAAVQFLMVYQNRVYNSYQRINISNPDKNLRIKLLTFHNKLQPGEKEQWKLQVSSENNEKQAAEMVADLYDASLDDITPPQNWQNALEPEGRNQPNYFAWNFWSFVQPGNSQLFVYTNANYYLSSRNYERLNMFGYSYYGGYNSAYQNYLKKINRNVINAENNKRLEEEYLKNAAKIKNGYDIIGRVIGADDKIEIPGVSVTIKGTRISTLANSGGYFKIRVPVNATLVFSFIGYKTFELATSKGGSVTISLKPAQSTLNEVVVTGYGTQLKEDFTGSVSTVMIRGIASPMASEALQGHAAGVQVINNGAPGTASNVYTRGTGDLGKPIIPRTNFAETAFFYPQLHTDEKGQILIDFTIPEALTRWRFRALAHTKDLATGYLETEVVTQKQLSISANTPRFLREGDTITISARLANLTAGKLKGKVQLQLFNALNMQPVSLFLNKTDAEQNFEVDGNTNKAVSFKLAIPSGLDALDYKLTADAGEFTDGEENTLPVLPNRTLVTESMPMMVRAGQTRDFVFDKFVNQKSPTLINKTLTLEYTANPAWYAVQALPYMMEFPYECSEQVFSRYFANSLGSFFINNNPAIKKVLDQWKSANSTELLSNLEKNQELKSTLIEETPWLRDAESETEQKKRIALLFDLNKMSDELKLTLDKLQKRQLPDGGFAWFGGEYADRYITQHILEGIGELYHIGIGKDDAQLGQMADDALGYLDNQIQIDEKGRKKTKQPYLYYGDLEIHAWFTRSYFLDKPMSRDLKAALTSYLKWAADEWKFRNVYEQGMIGLTMQRFGKGNVTAQIEKSLLETAQQSDDLGMYWAKNQLGYYWYESPIETQSLLIELFTEAGDNVKTVDEMKIWLLRNKQTNNWQTTKATAAACYALLLKGANLLADTGATSIKLNGKPLEELKPYVRADAGTGYLKATWADGQVKPGLGKVEIKNNSKTVSWGALHWQYLENLDKVTSSNTNIRLRRKYFIQTQTDAGPVLTAVDATHQPKTGDLLKIVVYLSADRNFEYVQLKDMRPAGTEPVDALSAYKYQDGLYCYQATKDVATDFFISELKKGSYVFEYRLRVAQPGNFSTGITSMQCMYAPEFNAHSEGGRMVVRP
jgi:uncharacterized protein YfaS (alpha-2-macroglobulin family)